MDFKTLTLTRQIACAPDRLFHLMTDRTARETWGAPGEGIVMQIDSFDLRPGGQEVSRCGPAESPEFTMTTAFHVVDAPARLICSETLDFGEGPVSVSLVTQEITAQDNGSHLTVTLQIASLIGPEMAADYQTGWNGGLDNLARMAEQPA